MEILVKSCRTCPFIEMIGERRDDIQWGCSRGAFGYSKERPAKETIPEQCPLLKDDIVVKARNLKQI